MEKNIDLNDTRTAFEYKSNKDLRRTLFIFKVIQRPAIVKFLTKVAGWIISSKLPVQFLLKSTIFKVFCAGEDRNEAGQTIRNLKQYDVHTVLDYVAEGDNSEVGFEKNLATILANIEFVADSKEGNSFVGVKLSGLEDVNYLEQLVVNRTHPDESRDRMLRFIDRTDKICALASELNVKVYFDAEERSTQDVFDFVVEKMMRKYNKEKVIVYNTLQMYLTDRIEYLEFLVRDSIQNEYLLGIKLVRGAYVEKERKKAEILGVQSPIHKTKEKTDQAYDRAVEICLTNHERVCTCLATHNQQSVEKAIRLIEELNMEDHYKKVFFSQLFGMSDNLTFNLAKAKFNSSKYVPYGELKKAIPYLLRRAEENTSIEGQASREYELLVQEKSRRRI